MNHTLSDFASMPGFDTYMSQVHPDLYKQPKPALIHNWSLEDISMFCGPRGVAEYLLGGEL